MSSIDITIGCHSGPTFMSSAEVVANGLSQLYENKVLTDLRIVCIDGSILAHKVVLASVSDKWRQLFSRETEGHNSDVHFVEHRVDDIKAILDVIYFGRQSVATNRAIDLSRISDQLFGIKLSQLLAIQKTHSSTACGQQSSECGDNGNTGLTALDVCPKDLAFNSKARLLCPKPAHQNSLRSSDKKTLKRLMAVENYAITLDQHLLAQSIEKPLDLSNSEMEDNVSKTIDSIAQNGPQLQRPRMDRRRKQTEPKQAFSKMQKIVRFEAEFSNELSDSTESGEQNDELFDILINNSTFNPQTSENSLSEMSAQLSVAPKAVDNQLDGNQTLNGIPDELSTELDKVMTSDPSIAAIKPLAKSKGRAKSRSNESQTPIPNECPNCDIEFNTYKHLIIHLNKEHKTDEGFRCEICGKTQKYAKKFLYHSFECRNRQ